MPSYTYAEARPTNPARGSPMRILAFITDPLVVTAIGRLYFLLSRPLDVPKARGGRLTLAEDSSNEGDGTGQSRSRLS